MTSEKIHSAILGVMRDVQPIAREIIPGAKYQARTAERVLNELHPLLAKHGIYTTAEVVKSDHDCREEEKFYNGKSAGMRRVYHCVVHVRYTYHAEDGSSVTSDGVGEALSYADDTASASAQSKAERISLCQLLKIPYAADRRPPREAPERDASKPVVPPRGERVQPRDISALERDFKKWRARQNQPQDRADFLRWIREHKETLSMDPASWTVEDVATLQEGLV